jgi:hypothetical protein
MATKPKDPDTSARTKANWFMIRVAESMAAWASFAQATRLSPVYSEALTYRPIFEIARPRHWKPWPQKKIAKRERKLGRNQTVDFAFRSEDGNGDIGVFLEVKFIRKKATHCAQVSKDVRKLVLLDVADISKKKPPSLAFRYILLIGRKEDIESRIDKHAEELGRRDLKKLTYREDKMLAAQVKSAFHSVRSARGYEAWAFAGMGRDEWKYYSVLLGEQRWWKQLARLKGKLVEDDQTEEDDSDLREITDEEESEPEL